MGLLKCLIWICLLQPGWITSQETNLEALRKKLIFNTGTVYWGLEESSKTFLFSSNIDNCSLSIRLNEGQYKELVQNITQDKLDSEDIFHIRILENTTFAEARSIEGFAAINRGKKSQFKFLPFRLEDMTSILQLTAPPIIREAQYFKTLDLYLPFPEDCKDLELPSSSRTIELQQLADSTTNIMITVLLLSITYNPYLDLPDVFEICALTQHYKDIPFSISTCCAVKEKLIFETHTRDQIIRCSAADKAREGLATFATILGFIFFLFVPLMVKYLPATPEEWQKIKEKYLKKCYSRKQEEKIEEENDEDVETGPESKEADTSSSGKPTTKLLQRWLPSQPSPATDSTAPVKQKMLNMLQADQTGELAHKDNLDKMTDHNPRDGKADATSTDDESSDDDDGADNKRVYLNKDSEYHMSCSLIVSYIVLLPSDSHIAGVLRRLIFLLFLWITTGSLFFITYIYYESIFDNCFLSPQRALLQRVFQSMYADEYKKFRNNDPDSEYMSQVMHAMSLSGPVALGCINMLLLYFLTIKPKDACQALSWHEPNSPRDHSLPYTIQFYGNMKYRLSRLVCKQFWKSWWDDCVCRCSPIYRIEDRTEESREESKNLNMLLQTVLMVVRIPFSVLYILFYTLPVFTFLHNVFAKPQHLLGCGPCNRGPKRFPFIVWLTFPVTVMGVALLYWMLFDLTLLLSHAGIFLTIDILRNSETTLPIVVFITSILLYVRQAFADFEDGYRDMKGKAFELSQLVAAEAEEKGIESVIAGNEKIKLIQRDRDGVLSIPKPVFKTICTKFRPYRQNLMKTIMKLLGSLMVVAFLFAITIEFQIFQQFSAVGEMLLMVVTVSIPGLFGMLKSDNQRALSRANLDQRVTATIRGLVKKRARGTVNAQGVGNQIGEGNQRLRGEGKGNQRGERNQRGEASNNMPETTL